MLITTIITRLGDFAILLLLLIWAASARLPAYLVLIPDTLKKLCGLALDFLPLPMNFQSSNTGSKRGAFTPSPDTARKAMQPPLPLANNTPVEPVLVVSMCGVGESTEGAGRHVFTMAWCRLSNTHGEPHGQFESTDGKCPKCITEAAQKSFSSINKVSVES